MSFFLGHNSAIPGHNSAIPGHNSAIPGHNSAIPGHNSAIPGHNSAIPETNFKTRFLLSMDEFWSLTKNSFIRTVKAIYGPLVQNSDTVPLSSICCRFGTSVRTFAIALTWYAISLCDSFYMSAFNGSKIRRLKTNKITFGDPKQEKYRGKFFHTVMGKKGQSLYYHKFI